LSALELHRNATATAAERRLQEFRPRQIRNDQESSAALIRKAETAVLFRSARYILDLDLASHNGQEAESERPEGSSNRHGLQNYVVNARG
jgi:hypothetical protein